MTPNDFRDYVQTIAAELDFPTNQLILGGDHLGPNPWKHLSAVDAMDRAKAMIETYARSGFTKLHLDTSMGCAGEPTALADELTAERAASLAKVAEAAVIDDPAPIYVIGTEVPLPGGEQHALESLEVTRPEAALRTVAMQRRAFEKAGLRAAFDRVIGVVVQPGVEFASADVVPYHPERARELTAALSDLPGLIFEAHSTDYQRPASLEALVKDGFAILKVGPWLTFALREALYGLDSIADAIDPAPREERLPAAMEALMLKEPQNWQRYYDGSADQLRFQRHFSFSDRIRYYWPRPEAQAAVERLFVKLGDERIAEPLISQYLGGLYPEVVDGLVTPRPKDLVVGAIQQVLGRYERACAHR
jgi:D-tagatose-bisphosphate aldolase class II non-catalytic subunit